MKTLLTLFAVMITAAVARAAPLLDLHDSDRVVFE